MKGETNKELIERLKIESVNRLSKVLCSGIDAQEPDIKFLCLIENLKVKTKVQSDKRLFGSIEKPKDIYKVEGGCLSVEKSTPSHVVLGLKRIEIKGASKGKQFSERVPVKRVRYLYFYSKVDKEVKGDKKDFRRI